MNREQEELLQAVDILIKKRLETLGYDYTKTGVVKSISDNTCIVEIDGSESKCKIKNGISISVGDVVIVKIINNNYSNKIVDGKLGVVGSGGDIGDIDCGTPSNVKIKIQLRKGVASEWSLVNPILAQAELGVEIDTKKWKIGDGVTPWNILPYSMQGEKGLDGKSIEFLWNNTKLGIKLEGETEYQFVDLKGEKGDTGEGLSAYQVWLSQGNIGSELDFLNSLKGEKGDTGSIEDVTASDISIADINSNFTSNNVEGALAELFTNVSDGKELIATAITDKGGVASGSDTFTELASAINNIGGGKKSASGTYIYDGGSGNIPVNISGLDFQPNHIALINKTRIAESTAPSGTVYDYRVPTYYYHRNTRVIFTPVENGFSLLIYMQNGYNEIVWFASE